MLKQDVSYIFRKYMFENRLKQIDVARKLGVSGTFVSKIINEKSNLSIDKLDEYAKKLGIELEIKAKGTPD